MDQRDTIIWDYDDTLGGIKFADGSIHPGAAAYDDTINRFVAYINNLGLDGERARTLQHDIDLVLAKKHGFGDKTRFAQSFRDTYLTMCEENGSMASKLVMDKCFDIGMSVFTDYPYVPLEGALDVLHELSKFYRPIIATKGEFEEQWKKLNQSGVAGFVDAADVFVMGKKDDADWAFLLGRVFGDYTTNEFVNCWAVGNSAKADVNPLVKLGFNGIHINGKNNWVFEHAALAEPLPGQVTRVVTDISEVLDIIPRPTL